MLIVYANDVKLPGEAKQDNLPPECGQPIDGGWHWWPFCYYWASPVGMKSIHFGRKSTMQSQVGTLKIEINTVPFWKIKVFLSNFANFPQNIFCTLWKCCPYFIFLLQASPYKLYLFAAIKFSVLDKLLLLRPFNLVLCRQHTHRQLTRHQAVFDAKSCRVLIAQSRLVCCP
jgi:hypothetical protein